MPAVRRSVQVRRVPEESLWLDRSSSSCPTLLCRQSRRVDGARPVARQSWSRSRQGAPARAHSGSHERRPGIVAIVVEPAKSGDLATIIIEAYGLTPRERDVVRAIARGSSTPDIAAELILSAHTVRDYIKAVFDKVGVSSRGELVAKLFAEPVRRPLPRDARRSPLTAPSPSVTAGEGRCNERQTAGCPSKPPITLTRRVRDRRTVPRYRTSRPAIGARSADRLADLAMPTMTTTGMATAVPNADSE